MGQSTYDVSKCDWCGVEVTAGHSCREEPKAPRMWVTRDGNLLCPKCDEAREAAIFDVRNSIMLAHP